MTNIYINNQPLSTSCSDLAALSAEQKWPERGVAVGINGKMVPRTEWAATPLVEGLRLLVIRAAAGG